MYASVVPMATVTLAVTTVVEALLGLSRSRSPAWRCHQPWIWIGESQLGSDEDAPMANVLAHGVEDRAKATHDARKIRPLRILLVDNKPGKLRESVRGMEKEHPPPGGMGVFLRINEPTIR